MAKLFSTCAAGLLALALASTVLATEDQGHAGKGAEPAPAVLVTVRKVTALDAQNKERLLYEDAPGMRLPLAELPYIGRRLRGEGLPTGVFHDFRVELGNDVDLSIPGREIIRTRLRRDGAPTVLRLLGTVVLPDDGGARPLKPGGTAAVKAMGAYGNPARRHDDRQGGHDNDDAD